MRQQQKHERQRHLQQPLEDERERAWRLAELERRASDISQAREFGATNAGGR